MIALFDIFMHQLYRMAALDGGIDSRYSDAVAFVGGLKNMPSGT
jgi:hypothetical protein